MSYVIYVSINSTQKTIVMLT